MSTYIFSSGIPSIRQGLLLERTRRLIILHNKTDVSEERIVIIFLALMY